METNEFIKNKYGEGLPKIIPGMTRRGLYKMFAELGFKTGCEVGVFRGRNAKKMFEVIPGLKLYCVEPFADQPYSTRPKTEARLADMKMRTYERLRGRDTVMIEKFSEDAVKDVPYDSLDFVYIDGDHFYDYVMLDVILWSRRVRKGGIVSGHDYMVPGEFGYRPDVNIKQAVDNYVSIHKIDSLYLTDRTVSRKLGDMCHSWFFIKT